MFDFQGNVVYYKYNSNRKENLMANVIEMAEAHLLNVQREIATLEQKKIEIDQEVVKLKSYLEEGVQELQSVVQNANENTSVAEDVTE